MRPTPLNPAACLRPLPEPRPKSSLFPGNVLLSDRELLVAGGNRCGMTAYATARAKAHKAKGPRRIAIILDEIQRSPGGVAGEAGRVAAKETSA